MIRRSLLIAIISLGLAGVLAACAEIEEGTKEDAAGANTIKIGALLPLSGGGAAYGTPLQEVLTIAVQQINDAGGVKGKKLSLVFEDGACNAKAANIAMNKLVSVKKVKYVIGGICNSETVSAAPVAEKNKVVLLSPASSNEKITEAGDFIFRNYPSDKTQGEVLAEYTKSKGYKKVGMLVEEQPFTEGIAEAFERAFGKGGGTTMVEEKYPSDGSDFRTQINKLQAAKVDAFLLSVQTPEKIDLIFKELKEAGVKGPFLMNDIAIGSPKEVIEKYKDFIEGSVGTEPDYDKKNPDVTKLQQAYKDKTGNDLPFLYVMAPAYDAVAILKEAFESVGEDSEAVKNYLYTVKTRKGLAGTLTFDKNGDSNYRYGLRIMEKGVVQEYKITK